METRLVHSDFLERSDTEVQFAAANMGVTDTEVGHGGANRLPRWSNHRFGF